MGRMSWIVDTHSKCLRFPGVKFCEGNWNYFNHDFRMKSKVPCDDVVASLCWIPWEKQASSDNCCGLRSANETDSRTDGRGKEAEAADRGRARALVRLQAGRQTRRAFFERTAAAVDKSASGNSSTEEGKSMNIIALNINAKDTTWIHDDMIACCTMICAWCPLSACDSFAQLSEKKWLCLGFTQQ